MASLVAKGPLVWHGRGGAAYAPLSGARPRWRRRSAASARAQRGGGATPPPQGSRARVVAPRRSKGATMSFASPLALLALAAVPLTVVALLLAQRRRVRYAVRYPALDVLAQVVGQVPRWRRHLPAAVFLLAVAALLVGSARPVVRVPVPREEATVMLVLDVSGSMNATDVEPNRLEAARAAAGRFVDKLPAGFRVGVVSFSDAADTLVQPTTDRGAVEQALASLHADGATAMGDGLSVALDAIERLGQQPGEAGASQQAQGQPHPPAVTLLLSDGANTSGSDPQQQAERARRLDVPVFTIALGTPGGVLRGPSGQVQRLAHRVPHRAARGHRRVRRPRPAPARRGRGAALALGGAAAMTRRGAGMLGHRGRRGG